MKADVLKSKGLDELANAEFEIVVDSVTGIPKIVLKSPSLDSNGESNTNFEIVIDAATGKQKIIKKTVVEQEDGIASFNIEKNMNRYDL